MLLVNLSDGSTVRVDLENDEQADRFRSQLSDAEFSSSICAISILHGGRVFALPRPPRLFQQITWDADLVRKGDKVTRERVHCYADQVKATLTVYRDSDPPMSRVDLSRPGRLAVRRPHRPG